MNRRMMSSAAALATAVLGAGAAQAQQAETLPETVAEGDRIAQSYALQPGNDTGTTVIDEQEIKARTPGSGDVNQILKALPTVQFSRNEGAATREDIQDLRPADISISGGRIYDNLFTVDGVDATSRLDSTEDNPLHFAEPVGNSPQNMWLDSNLVGEILLRDSNVSAEFGRFTGGALDIRTRDPRRRFGVTATASYTSDALVDFRISDASRAALGTDPLPERPNFEKWRFGATVDVPISEDVAVLVGANRSRSTVTYQRLDTYGGDRYGKHSISDNLLVKGTADLSGTMRLTGQFTYSPYESEASAENGIDNLVTSKGGAIAGSLKLEESSATRWSVTAQYSHADSGRDASPNNYSIPSSSTNGAVCSTTTNCTIGGFGNIDQWQDTLALKADFGREIGLGELRAGVDYQRVEALRSRPESNYAYSRGVSSPTIVCADGDSLLCATGDYALTQYSEYRAYRAKVTIDSVSAWAEYDATLGKVDLRAGVRYDYESFLGNHNVAPRLSLTYALPMRGWSVTAGANRYYGRSMLAYALREQYPDNFIFRRTGTTSGGVTTYSDADWYLYSTSHSLSYGNSGLKTPYSDELTGAVTGRLFGGTVRLKGILRWGEDEFSRSIGDRVTKTLENGNTSTYTLYTLTNNGSSRYRGVSLEWTRSFGRHSVAANVNYSKTTTHNADYLTLTDEDEYGDDKVVYNGQVVTWLELAEQNQRLDFASPLIANLTWTGRWLDDRLTTNVNLRYRNGFDQYAMTGGTQVVDGVRYDVVELIHYRDNIDLNVNVQADVIRSRYGTLTAEARVSNALNRIPLTESTLTSQPYQYGRSFWFGLSYRY